MPVTATPLVSAPPSTSVPPPPSGAPQVTPTEVKAAVTSATV